MGLTERHDLVSSDPPWDNGAPPFPADRFPERRVDVAIVGAGVTGALIAERLTAGGARVALVDRRPPARGSTAASTALVMWAADVPLTTLAERIGREAAAARWARVRETVTRLRERIDAETIDCGARRRPVVYLEGALLPGETLIREGEARRAAGLSSAWLDGDAVAARFGIGPRAALVSDDGFGVDPVRLTLAMLARASASGAAVVWPCDARAIEPMAGGVALRTDRGTIVADRVVLAPGYERARLFLPPAFTLSSSYAIATAPGAAPLWREEAMLWEAAAPYLYARSSPDGRIVAGGEDEDNADAAQRDARIGGKAGTIAEKLGAMLGREIAVDRRWAATFGSSPDGLPAIGPARNQERVWLASGFGGNGVSFAALAAELLAAAFGGAPDRQAAGFDPYRFET